MIGKVGGTATRMYRDASQILFFPRKVKGDGKVFAMARLSKLYLGSARRGRFCFFTTGRPIDHHHRCREYRIPDLRIYLSIFEESSIFLQRYLSRVHSQRVRSAMSESCEREFVKKFTIIVIFISKMEI